ncbi:protein LMBR1L isoform X8 [Papio anubis]|uniref:protein LMBR1L isoform X8 n=1 Tax=Papio anubis TaxID=9555 RepID=UPI0012AE7261|nr:protein LMBR1L isoform X8 [Papio anubis]
MGLLLKLGWMKGRNRHSELDSRKEGRCRDGRREEPGDLVGHLLLWKKGVLLGWILICRDEEQPSIQISTLLFATLYILCHIFLTRFKKPAEFTTVDDADATVNKIALELCTFTLAIALGAVLLLPFSIISNEVLLSLPRNYYIQWLNGSLIHGLWNLVFLFSNLSLIFLMPFAYFFTESEGFAGSRKTSGSTISPTSTHASPSLGFCCSWLLEDLEEQLYCSAFEEAALTRRICNPTSCWLPLDMELLHRQLLALQTQRVLLGMWVGRAWDTWVSPRRVAPGSRCLLTASHPCTEKRRKASAWQRNLGYPLAMLCLLVLTGLSVLIVAIHILELLIDEAAMPRGMQGASLGQVSFSKLGSFGAVVQVVLIFYLMVSSVVGFYSSPLFRSLRPRWHDTAMTQIIGNCVCLLVLSSALPVFSRTLGPGTSSRPWEFLGTPVARGGPLLEEKIPDSGSEAEASLAADTLNSPELLVSLPSRIGRGQPISCSVEMWPPGGSTKLDW